jgi:hypothetical protein
MVDNLATFMCRFSWNFGASISWNSLGLSRPVIGLLYLYNPTCIYSSCLLKFLDHPQTHTIDKTPLIEWSARRRGRYLQKHTINTRNKGSATNGARTHDPKNRLSADLRLTPALPPGSALHSYGSKVCIWPIGVRGQELHFELCVAFFLFCTVLFSICEIEHLHYVPRFHNLFMSSLNSLISVIYHSSWGRVITHRKLLLNSVTSTLLLINLSSFPFT